MKYSVKKWHLDKGLEILSNSILECTGCDISSELMLFSKASSALIIKSDSLPFKYALVIPVIEKLDSVCYGHVRCFIILRNGDFVTSKINKISFSENYTSEIIKKIISSPYESHSFSFDKIAKIGENLTNNGTSSCKDIDDIIFNKISQCKFENFIAPSELTIEHYMSYAQEFLDIDDVRNFSDEDKSENKISSCLKFNKFSERSFVYNKKNVPQDYILSDIALNFKKNDKISSIKGASKKACLIWSRYMQYSFSTLKISVNKEAIKYFTQFLNKDYMEMCSLEQNDYENYHNHSTEKICNPNIYNWVNADGDNLLRIYRSQALKEFPILVEYLIDKKIKGKTELEIKEINLDSIDKGESVIDFIKQSLNMPNSLIKSLRGISQGKIDYLPLHNMESISENMDDNHWPNGCLEDRIDQWNKLLRSIKEIRVSSFGNSYNNYCLPKTFAEIIRSEQPFWLARKSIDNIINGHIPDMICDFSRLIVFPYIFDVLKTFKDSVNYNDLETFATNKKQGASIASNMWRDRSFVSMSELSNKWNNNYQKIDALIVKETDKRIWPGLFNDMEIDGILFKPLTSAVDLSNESMEMDHCVQTYVRSCLTGNSHIISLMNSKTGEKLSTLELMLNFNYRKIINIRQNQGKSNESVSKDIEKTSFKLIDKLESDISLLKLEEIFEFDKDMKEKSDINENQAMIDIIGYDILNPEVREIAITACQFMIPKYLRNLNYQDYVIKSGLHGFIMNFLSEDDINNFEESHRLNKYIISE